MKYLLLIFLSLPSFANQGFEAWKESYIKRATKRGLSRSFLSQFFKELKLDTEVIEKDRNQITSSTKADYQAFIKRWLRKNNERVSKGKALLKENFTLLQKVEDAYGVDKKVIVALWGVETFYGEIVGDYDLIRSLSSLAYEGRRKKFFEIQLNAAFRMLRDGHVSRERLKGSWAGATGQCQFMPSNIPGYAVDYNLDGKKDIWNTKADIFASIANLLKKGGWKKGKSIGSLAYNADHKDVAPDIYRSALEYNRLGFTDYNGMPINSDGWTRRRFATIPLKNSPVVLRGSNFGPLMKWNNSALFAAFVILISEQL